MKVKPVHMVVGGAVVVALVVLGSGSFKQRLLDKLAEFIARVESFSAKAYWDVSRYSWGYGTAAPSATAVTTRANAFTEMINYLMDDYDTLSRKITRRLTVNQWVALLSFSYNLGVDDALNLVPVINSGDDVALRTKWVKYVYAGGVVNQNLVTRRNLEIDLWET